MTLDELVLLSNQAVAKAQPGDRPGFIVEVEGVLQHRRVEFKLGPATITGKNLGPRNAGSKEKPKWMSGVRFFCDEVHRELEKRGMVQKHKVADRRDLQPILAEMAKEHALKEAARKADELVGCAGCDQRVPPGMATEMHRDTDGNWCDGKRAAAGEPGYATCGKDGADCDGVLRGWKGECFGQVEHYEGADEIQHACFTHRLMQTAGKLVQCPQCISPAHFHELVDTADPKSATRCESCGRTWRDPVAEPPKKWSELRDRTFTEEEKAEVRAETDAALTEAVAEKIAPHPQNVALLDDLNRALAEEK